LDNSRWGKPHNQIDHILTGEGIQVHLMSDHSGQQIVIMTTILWWQKLGRDWLWINKDHTDFYTETFNFRKLNKVEGKEKCHIEVSNKFEALGDLDAKEEA
jgi:hypothetical protein